MFFKLARCKLIWNITAEDPLKFSVSSFEVFESRKWPGACFCACVHTTFVFIGLNGRYVMNNHNSLIFSILSFAMLYICQFISLCWESRGSFCQSDNLNNGHITQAGRKLWIETIGRPITLLTCRGNKKTPQKSWPRSGNPNPIIC